MSPVTMVMAFFTAALGAMVGTTHPDHGLAVIAVAGLMVIGEALLRAVGRGREWD